MGHDRPRWRIRLSTLMLLVVIAALATYIVVERWQRVQEARRLAAEAQAEAQRVVAALQQSEAQARRASSSAQAGTSTTADK